MAQILWNQKGPERGEREQESREGERFRGETPPARQKSPARSRK
jgi:hypothetical protein